MGNEMVRKDSFKGKGLKLGRNLRQIENGDGENEGKKREKGKRKGKRS